MNDKIRVRLVDLEETTAVLIVADQGEPLHVHTASNQCEGSLAIWSVDPQAVLVALRDAAIEALKKADRAEADHYADSELGADVDPDYEAARDAWESEQR
jgi:hypothetical protein